MNLNKVILAGRLTRDPELRTTQGGTSVATIGLATSETWTDKSGKKQERTEFHTIVAWGRTGEIVTQYSKKGDLLLVEGRLQTRSWEDTKTGSTRKATEIVADSVQLGPKRQAAVPMEDEDPGPMGEDESITSEIPF